MTAFHPNLQSGIDPFGTFGRFKIRFPPIADISLAALPERMKRHLSVVAVACCASACAAQTSQPANAGFPTIEQTEPQYPFGGFLFTGRADALEKLRQYGEGHGLTLTPYPQSPTQPALLLAGDAAFNKMEATRDLVNRSQAGQFGEVRLGLISEPPPR